MRHSCAKSRTWVPTRLLDIRDDSSFRLCLTSHEQILDPEYTTLSYRWGKNGSDMKLTEQSLSDLCSGRPISSLPRTFQDAILVTKRLGIRWLWIDALCIFQDGQDDFHRECALMSEIYARSSCNIVATFGKDPHESLFQQRCFEKLEIGRATGVWRSKKGESLWIGLNALVPGHYIGDELLCSEVYSRGWILQELLLAPRTLLFGRNQVHWKCAELEACETWPTGVPSHLQASIDLGFPKIKFADGQEFRDWSRIVERYSRLELTKEKDKLVALSGIAKSIQQHSEDQYLAGHWRTHFLRSLIWKVRQGFRLPWLTTKKGGLDQAPEYGRRISDHIAPSWSWASIIGPISYRSSFLPENYPDVDRTTDALCIIEAITAGPSEDGAVDVLGIVAGAQLTIRSSIVPKSAFETFLNTLPDFHHQSSIARRRSIWDTGPDPSRIHALFAPIFATRMGSVSLVWYLSALILVPKGIGGTIYTREGIFEIRFYSEDMEVIKSILDAAGLEFADEEGGPIQVKESARKTIVIK